MVEEKRQNQIFGEVNGSFLAGLVSSLGSVYVITSKGLKLELPEINPQDWYPYSLLVDTLKTVELSIPEYRDVFFQAGVNFVRVCTEHGPGKELIFSTMDWLLVNKDSAGYNAAVRGGTPEEIGWCLLLEIDVERGFAIYENVMPLHPDYVRGVFYGGCDIFGDVDYFEVTETHDIYDADRLFYRTIITVRFRLKPETDCDLHDLAINNLIQGDDFSLDSINKERLALQFKSLTISSKQDLSYRTAIDSLFVHAIEIIKQQHDEIHLLSNTDPLTGLPNLRVANERLLFEHSRAEKDKKKYGVLFIDVDKFKEVNDNFGHACGDFVLKAIAIRSLTCVRASDTVARIGGDEFIVLLPDISQPNDALVVAEKIRSLLEKPIFFRDEKLLITVSIGISLFPDHGNTINEIMNNADRAMYDVKINGRDGCRVFDLK